MIELDRVSKRFGETLAVDNVSLQVPRGAITVIVGTSGSGKSTLLRLINRLIEPDQGAIRIAGVDALSQPADKLRRGIGYVIQDHGLFPHWSVARNIATVPALLGWDRARIGRRVRELMLLFGLDPERQADLLPHRLSGGQRQRVGVARALAAEPEAMLMDEPFGALDAVTRESAQAELREIQRRLGVTIVLVTHDLEEAIRLADRIAVMDAGRILQEASPAMLLARPAEGFVERLVGGAERPFRLLSLTAAAALSEPGEAPGPPIAAAATLRDALSAMLWRGVETLPVEDAADRGPRRITLAAIVASLRDAR